jgi:hypothetical protein
MKLTITAFSDPEKLAGLKEEIDVFVEKYSENPFYLSVFLEKQMHSTNGLSPFILIFKAYDRIVGLVPLLVTEKIGIRSAQFLYNFYFSPDFVFNNMYSNSCMAVCLDFIFKNLHCQSVTFDLPADSPNLNLLQLTCYQKSIRVIKKDGDFSHAVIPLKSSWDEFLNQKNKNFKKDFQKAERRIVNECNGKVMVFKNLQDEENAFRMIMTVEQQCWKQGWRQNNEVTIDDDLLNIWSNSSSEIRINPNFNRRVWFLTLNETVVAYNLAILYKGTAYFCKTSFDNRYRRLYPGVFLNNVAIRELFNDGDVKFIDFMTNLPFHARWTKTRLERKRLLLSKGFVPKLLDMVLKQLRLIKNGLPNKFFTIILRRK